MNRVTRETVAYCGTIGPERLPTSVLDVAEKLGRELVAWADLRGAWGIDFILKDDVPFPIEVNPRYTAAVEVVEHETGTGAYRGGLVGGATDEVVPTAPQRVIPLHIGKAIYYAPHAIAFPPSGRGMWIWHRRSIRGACRRSRTSPDRAPRSNPVRRSSPFSRPEQRPAEVRERLQSRAVELDVLFRKCEP